MAASPQVFISKIPRESTEAQLRTFCEQAGEVFAVRLPRDPASGMNKG